MAQLDLFSFLSQSLWVFIIFTYYFVAFKSNILVFLSKRLNSIESFVEKASKLSIK